ncbi:cell division inhibitor SepF [Cryobacterium sp. CG_9.6]|nr:cell division protein SepF [Cryobacterium sp. CG_9.6]MDH6237216.1 cell division inhibitor SepF [Cryobacterium sp. CG_9.6]
MSNPLKKTMVYLGLADEELEYEAPAGRVAAVSPGTEHGAAHAPAERSTRGSASSSNAQNSGAQTSSAHNSGAHNSSAQNNSAHNNSAHNNSGRAPVTPLRKTSTPQNVAASEMNEILTVHPRQYRDAQIIAESFREGIPVIINLSQMSDADARRLIDFASGLSQGLYGKIERVTAKVFLLSPSHVVVSGDNATEDSAEEASFFAQA